MREDPADEIQRIMEKEGLSQADVDHLGFPASKLTKIRRKIVSPTWGTIQKIANALGYTAFVVFRKERK